jgi:hypothetical protein
MPQKKCDWIGCSEIGFFDGRDKTLLTNEGKKHIFALLKWVFLCPYHFKLGVGSSENSEEQTRIVDEPQLTKRPPMEFRLHEEHWHFSPKCSKWPMVSYDVRRMNRSPKSFRACPECTLLSPFVRPPESPSRFHRLTKR